MHRQQNSLLNLVKGIGTIGDSEAYYQLRGAKFRSWAELEHLATEPLIQNAISLHVDEWQDLQFSVKAEKEEDAELATTEIRKLIPVVREAYRHSLIFGGAAIAEAEGKLIAVGADELYPNETLGGIKEFTYCGQYLDGTISLKPEDLVIIDGLPLTRRLRQANRGWGLSYVDLIADSVAHYEASVYSLGRAVHKANLLVYGMAGMSDLVGTEDDRAFLREHIQDVVSSVEKENVLPIDIAAASATFLQRNLSGLKELHDTAMDDLVAKTRLPYSVFFNTKGKTGLGADDSETQRYHQKIDAICESLKEKIIQVAKLIGLWEDSWTLEYSPLHVEDAKVAAETQKILAEASAAKINAVTGACNAAIPVLTTEEARDLLGMSQALIEDADQKTSLIVNTRLDPLQQDVTDWLGEDDPLLAILFAESPLIP